jgi:hypothetical protein
MDGYTIPYGIHRKPPPIKNWRSYAGYDLKNFALYFLPTLVDSISSSLNSVKELISLFTDIVFLICSDHVSMAQLDNAEQLCFQFQGDLFIWYFVFCVLLCFFLFVLFVPFLFFFFFPVFFSSSSSSVMFHFSCLKRNGSTCSVPRKQKYPFTVYYTQLNT